jgi:hypothetical protein
MFAIDTGIDRPQAPNFDTAQVILDAAADEAGPNATQCEIDACAARMVVRRIVNPKKAETVRHAFAVLWPSVIAPMAHTSPASFDFIISEFAERLAELG